jgi:protein-S-isoprenylcysteine O-methyltransferase Ste14
MTEPPAFPPASPNAASPTVDSTAPAAATESLSFGGPFGALVMMTLLPVLTLYLWACIHLNGGALVWPSRKLVAALPLPSLNALAWILGFIAFQCLLDVLLPGREYMGAPQKDGHRRAYRLNGFFSLVVTLALLAALLAAGALHGTQALLLLGPLLVTSIGLAYAFSAFLYFYGKRQPSFEAPHLHGAARIIYDYFMGTGLNPRIGRVDLKMFMESKIAMTGWLMLTLLMAHAEYEQQGELSLAMALVCLFQAFYTFDFFWFEEAMLSTWDINHENYGFMLAFAFLTWMPFNFSLQSQYLVHSHPALPPWAVIGLLALNFGGYYIFRSSNLQKHHFRKGTGAQIWGREPEYIQTQRGTRLLASGWWGLSRHANYLGDLMMALAWCLACGVSHVVPFFYFIYFAPLLIARERRDDQHCAQKYGADWDTYRKRVPWRIVPFLY